MAARIKKLAEEHRLNNGACIYTVDLTAYLSLEIAKCFVNYKNCKISIDKLLLKKTLVIDFIDYLLAKKYTVENYKGKFFCVYKYKKLKKLFFFKNKLVIGQQNKCSDCGKCYVNYHVCYGDCIRSRNYLEVKLPKLPNYSEIIDVIVDIECCFIKDRHVPVLLCISYELEGILVEKSFYTVEGFFKWLKDFCLQNCKINSRVNLIGFNSSRYDFIFFMKECRKYIMNNWTFQKQKYNYIQKGGAIIYNTFYIGPVSVWFVDILRYTGGVTSLKQIAKDLKISQEKGAYPFKTLTLEKQEIELDEDDFFAGHYFETTDQYHSSKKMWMDNDKCSFFNLLEIYCVRDVRVTMEVWKKICHMYNSYVPFIQNEHITKFHGAPSLTKWISLKYALDKSNLSSLKTYNCKTKTTKIKIYAPNYDSYFLWADSVYGGWVGCHQQGIINEQLGMVDIVSHYPTSFTCYYGIGKPRKMTNEELRHFEENIASYDLENIPIFCCEVNVTPPKKITNFCSPLPQRCKMTLTWSYLKCKQNLNSIDIWHCVKYYQFKFTLLRGEIFPKKAMIFRQFVECFAKMKNDGKQEKNDLKTKCGKIGLNSGIGKYGEKKERLISKIAKTEQDVKEINLLLSNNNKYLRHELMDIITHKSYEEYVIKEFDVTCNTIPIHIISLMFSYSRVIKMDLIRRSKLNNCSIFSPRNKTPGLKYGDTDSIVITARMLRYLKKHSPTLFDPSIGFYNPQTKNFDYHVEVEELFRGRKIPKTRFALFFGLKAYMIVTTRGTKYKCKGHRIAEPTSTCRCGSGDKQWFCIGCLEKNFDNEEKINIPGVTLQHFYNCVRGNHHKFQYLRFERNLNRPIGKGKKPFSIKNKYITISLNYKDLNHKYDVVNKICYPFTQLD